MRSAAGQTVKRPYKIGDPACMALLGGGTAGNDGDLAARLGPSATRHILMPRRCEDTLVPDVLCHRATSRLVHDMVSHRLAALEASVLSQRLCLASSYLNRVECVGGQEVWPGMRFHPAAKT